MLNLPENWNDVHHAVFIDGDKKEKETLLSFLAKNNIKTKGNPDLYEIDTENFGIDDVRRFVTWVYMKPIAENEKLAIVCTESISSEAQNSLLKSIEEPPSNTYIFFVVKQAKSLLPTLLSRVMFYVGEESLGTNMGESFLKANIAERFKMIKKFSNKDDKSILKKIIKEIEIEFSKKFDLTQINSKTLRNIIDGSRYANIRGGSPKMILEWLSTVIPEKIL